MDTRFLYKYIKLHYRKIITILVVLSVILIDYISKQWALQHLGSTPHIELSPFFDLTLVWNKGISFGLLSTNTNIVRYGLIIFSLLISILLFTFAWKSEDLWLTIALNLIIGGAIGNMIDRIHYGAVIDFLDFSDLKFPWVFNFADSAINIGAFMLFLTLFTKKN